MSAFHSGSARRLALRILLSPSLLLGAGLAIGAAPAMAGPADGYEPPPSQLERFRAYPWFERAYRLQRQGDVRAAIVAMEQGLARQPGAVHERLVYADLLTAAGRQREAVGQLDRLLAASADLLPALLRRAMLRAGLGDVIGARADYGAVASHPRSSAQQRDAVRTALMQFTPPAQTLSAAVSAIVEPSRAAMPKEMKSPERTVHPGVRRAPPLAMHRVSRSLAAAQPPAPPTLEQEAHRSFELGRYEEAARIFAQLASNTDQAPPARAELLMALGHSHQAAGRHADAAQAFDAAARLQPRRDRLEALAMAALTVGEPQRALEAFETLWQREAQATDALAVARLSWTLGRAAEAIERGEQALAAGSGLPPQERGRALAEIGFMHATAGEVARAESLWHDALALEPDPGLAVRLAHLQHRSGRGEAALATLASQQAADPASAALLEDARADLLESGGRLAEAYAALQRAEQARPSGERRRRTAMLSHALHRPEAIELLESALADNGADVELLMTLGYACEHEGRAVDAAAAFGRVVSLYPGRVDALRALGYAQLRSGRRDEAIHSFRQAILRLETPGTPPPPPSEALAPASLPTAAAPDLDRELALRTLRSEVRWLNDRFDVIASQTYRRKSSSSPGALPFIAPAAATPSQGGLQVGWRPSGTALPGEREWMVYGRTVWGNRDDSLAIDSDSVQGAVGLRLQLVPGWQLYLAGERLIRIGENTRSDNAVRLTAGWSDGTDRPLTHPRSWNYTTLYADLGRLVQQHQTTAYFEARQGRSFAVGERWSVTPHLVAVAAKLRPDPSDLSYSELGAGVSLRTQFGGNRFESHAGTFDVVMQYRKGFQSSPGGWVVSAVLGF